MPNAIPHRIFLLKLDFFTIRSYTRNRHPKVPAEKNVEAKNKDVFSVDSVNFWVQLNVPSAIPCPKKISKMIGINFLSNDNLPDFVEVM